MLNLALFDEPVARTALLPLTYLRPVAAMRVGVWTIAEKWENLGARVSHITQDYLQGRFQEPDDSVNLMINGALCPDDEVIRRISEMKDGQVLEKQGNILAISVSSADLEDVLSGNHDLERVEYEAEVTLIDKPWKIYVHNGEQLRRDIRLHTEGRDFEFVRDPNTAIYGAGNVFVGKNVIVKAAVIDAEDGPVYLADNTIVSPGSLIKGPFAMLEGSVLSMGARMRGDITIGPGCKVGGEVGNSIFFGNSNKAHDGYLGNSVIAEWCNLGADTNTSNMKNDYGEVKLWNYGTGRFERTGRMFCGLMMGDHSKAGINVMFNSGTSVGVSSSVYNSNYPRNFIPSFVKGGASGWSNMSLAEASLVAGRVMARRNREFSETDSREFEKVFELSASYRRS